MMYAIPSGGCFCPILPPFCYGTSPAEEGETVPTLELMTSQVYEGDLDAFMKKNGATELKEGRAYLYPKKRGKAR
ncbi:hypothetical protein KDJ56_19265 [Brevibacillus composti]|uniref:Uncharacterized protein n=1 Tax=Brevibacillus composti TaxID=2796470 RepID=A0A7T5JNE1_9BACL|nr:hypothetical protein [Brevibacillus composti]QQE73982.1 hypothetical protein JD108_19330 [Brevibacillus composti]QUO41066.1 hypothetical protein KDJ56_19265 [Brevibacillus composti]